jgi:PAS domain S-box-containing protein
MSGDRGRRPLRSDDAEPAAGELEARLSAALAELEKARAEAQLHANWMETLTRLTRTIAASLEPDVILPAVADAAVSLFPECLCRLWTVDGERLLLRAEAGTGAGKSREGREVKLGEGLLGRVVASGKPAIVEDLARSKILSAAERSRSDGLAAEGLTSAAALPLVIAGRAVGVIALFSRQLHLFPLEEVKALEALAEQAAVALTKAHLFQDIQDRRRLTEDLYALTVAMTLSMELQHRTDTFVERTRQALGFDRVSVMLATPDGSALELISATDLTPEASRRIPLSVAGALQMAWESRATVVISSDAELAKAPPLAPELRRHPVLRSRRFAVVPLTYRDELIGLVAADHKRSRRPITRRGVAHLELFCQQLAHSINNARLYGEARQGAVENARLYTAAQQNLAQAALLNEAARTLHRTLDVKRLLPDAIANLGQTFGATGAAVELFGEGSAAQLEEVRWGEWSQDAVRAAAEPLRRREAPLLIADVEARQDIIPSGLLAPGSHALAAFPVRGRSRVLGGLTLLFAGPRPMSEAETRLLAAYADQLAMALDNAALFEVAENKRTQLEQVFASTSDGFLVLDLEGRVVAFNKQGGALLGIAPDTVVGRPFRALVDALSHSVAWEDRGGQALAAAVVRRSEPAAGDLELRLPERRTLRWHTMPTGDLLGNTVGVTVTLRDVTREREIDRMKTEFVSVVSHELRTPLTSIKGSLHLLLSDPALRLDETQRHLIDISVKNTDRLIRLITNILDISKIEAGRMQLDFARHRPCDFVAMALEGIRGFGESRGVVLEGDVPEELPAVRVDFDRMVQVVTNLLSNAIKFSPIGGRVRVSGRTAGGEVELSVSDQGRGIAPEDLSRLFRKFQQLDGSNVREVGGTGLGLAICRGIVEEHGGRIGVESQPGAGSTFIVSLPVAGADAAAPGPATAGGQRADAPLILVVDDESDLRALLRDQLEMEGFRVMEAGRALEAVELARERRPDLITMDVMLPDLDGFEAIRLLRAQPETRATPVVILSAVEVEPGDTRALGATMQLTKPFGGAALLKAIRAGLRAGKGTGS